MKRNNPLIIFKKNAFSLIEILIAVIIVGVIASIALSQYGIVVEKSRAKEGEQRIIDIITEMRRYRVEGNNATPGGQVYSGRPSQYFSGVGGIEVNPGGSNTCIYYFTYRNGNPDTIPGPTGCGGMALTGGVGLYMIYGIFAMPQGQFQIGCKDPGTGICARMGY